MVMMDLEMPIKTGDEILRRDTHQDGGRLGIGENQQAQMADRQDNLEQTLDDGEQVAKSADGTTTVATGNRREIEEKITILLAASAREMREVCTEATRLINRTGYDSDERNDETRRIFRQPSGAGPHHAAPTRPIALVTPWREQWKRRTPTPA